MTEVASFRIEEDEARKYLAGDEGVYLGGGTRELRVRTADPLFARIGEIAQELWTKRRVFFTSWQIRREYSAQECERAELFQLKIDAVFEPCGEECGTQYDESSACPVSGTGSRQASELVLNTRKI